MLPPPVKDMDFVHTPSFGYQYGAALPSGHVPDLSARCMEMTGVWGLGRTLEHDRFSLASTAINMLAKTKA